ncbi:MAG: hypothetical protein KDI44_19180, partial [Thiothrix sp.]|nr:hypothetical protein [Thiothrix sp.]
SRAVQDKAFIDFTNLNIQRGRKSGALQDDADAGQIAGYAKAAHLLGSGGADAYVLSGDDGADANGTTASKYYAQGRDAVLNASADNQPKAKQNTDAGKNPLDALEEEAAAREVTQANRELAGLAPAASRPGYQQNTRPATPPPPGYLTRPGPTAISPESIQQDVTSTTPAPGVQVGNGEITIRINPGYHPSPSPQQENAHAGLDPTRPLDAPAQPANAAATSTQPRPVDALAGRQATLYDAANNEYIAEYEVIDAAALSPSIEKADNQYRDRNRTAMQAQVDSIAANPIYGRLNTQHSTFTDGAPVLTQDQTLVAGNGRMAGLKQAYEQGNADNYRQQLMTDAHRLGLDTEAIGQMQQPVLVRRLTDSNTDTRKLAILSNVGTGASMSDLEQAKVDAEYIQHLGDFNPDDNADINFQSAPGLFQRLRAAVPESERNSIMTADGKVSADGARRVRNALMYMAYGDSKVLSDMVESQDPDHVNITKALLQAAPRLAEMRDSIRQGIVYDADITPDIVQSFSLFKQIRRDQGNTLESWLNQQDAFGDTPDTVKSLIRRMDEGAKKPSQLRDFLNNYADKLKTYGNPNQQGMFGGNPVPTKQEVLQRAERDTYQQSDASTTAETTSNSVGRPAGTGNTGTTGPQAAGQPGVNEAGAGGAGRSGTVGDTRFHISGRKPADITDQDTELTAAWKYIAQSDDAFQLPVSGKKSLEDIAADYNPNIRVEKSFELRDSITWSVKVPVAGGEIREVFVDEEKGGKREIFMDISQFQPGEGGNLLYQMVGDYAHNTGKIFAGDPSGLSPIAQIRRTENMLSSALRWGTTDHLRPHPLQLKPESDQVAPLSWKDGDTIYNLDQMLRTTMQNTLNMVPELKQVVYNPDKKQFEKVNGDGSTEPVSDRLFTEMARTGHGRRAATGSSTLKRAVYSSSVLQGQGQKVRHGLLGKIISQWSKPRLDQPLEGILYHLQPSTLNQTIRQVADTHGLDATTE